ncbi:hypothetical protein SNOG_11516 [Parastagonospora nodorum SN15]|uniref:Uncharacterized protein n=1 Tax=Phaeosphaeria nodorum (strain SN15 / ATCC MYA-4574 / FGSC 10173) TaxID=321614 RepID=Q0U9P8_PHANO|nr:hypothetical protein SNOG_11516 [Parastagonospora nodorum SN15]EAT81224.1 hypothetical protein SNOG_11516 [Parastagonospora nodorum SN15]
MARIITTHTDCVAQGKQSVRISERLLSHAHYSTVPVRMDVEATVRKLVSRPTKIMSAYEWHGPMSHMAVKVHPSNAACIKRSALRPPKPWPRKSVRGYKTPRLLLAPPNCLTGNASTPYICIGAVMIGTRFNPQLLFHR